MYQVIAHSSMNQVLALRSDFGLYCTHSLLYFKLYKLYKFSQSSHSGTPFQTLLYLCYYNIIDPIYLQTGIKIFLKNNSVATM